MNENEIYDRVANECAYLEALRTVRRYVQEYEGLEDAHKRAIRFAACDISAR